MDGLPHPGSRIGYLGRQAGPYPGKPARADLEGQTRETRMRLSCLHNCATPPPAPVFAAFTAAFCHDGGCAALAIGSYESFRRRFVAPEEITLPSGKPIDQIVVDVFRRASNQQTVFDLFGVLVLRPAIASFAERNFVPLRGFV